MCNVTAFNDYVGRLEDYLTFVNTNVVHNMLWEPEFYAGYGAYNGLKIEEIKDWYEDAEDQFIWGDPDEYIRGQYDHYIREDDVWDLVEREIDAGTIYECGGYWFRSE